MRITAAKPLLLIIASLTVLLKLDALVLTEPVEYYLNTPSSISTGPLEFNITARIVAADPITACTTINNPDELNGNFVLVADGTCKLETQARAVQAAGGIGMIQREQGSKNAGLNRNAYSDANRDDITIPIVFISGPDGLTLIDLIANSSQVVAIVSSGDTNIWELYQISAAPIALLVVHGVIDLSLAAFAIYKLVWYFKNKKTTISVAQMSLALMIVGLFLGVILRVVVLLANHNILSISSSFVLGAVFVPVTLLVLAALIVSFYWFELTSKVSAISRAWSRRLWIPFLVGCGILVALLIVLLLWPIYFRITIILIVIFSLYAVIVLVVSIIWIVFGAKLHRALTKNQARVSDKNSAQFKKLTALIIICACLLILMCVTIALANIIGSDQTTNAVIFELAQFFAEGTTAVIIFLFSTKKKNSNSSDRSNSLNSRKSPRPGSTTVAPMSKVDSIDNADV